MIKKILFFIPIIALFIAGCKKQDTPNTNFTLTATLHGSSSVFLKWPTSNLTGFKNVTIYKSTSPIPDPTFDKPIDGNLEIALITDNTVTSFLDSSVNIATNGTAYYKIVLNLNNRFIVSNQAEISLNAFAIELPNTSGFLSNDFTIKRIPEIDMLYVFDFSQGVISAVNYSQKKIIAFANFSSNSTGNNYYYACMNNNNPELFVYSNSAIICYDGLTLNQKYSMNVPSVSNYKVKNGFLYLYSNGYIYTFDLASKQQVSQLYVSVPNGYNLDIFGDNQTNALYVKYYTENSYYQQSTSSYVYSYKNIITRYNIINGLLSTSTNLNIAALNPDTNSSANVSNTNNIQISPDEKYLSLNQNGGIYSLVNNSLSSITEANYFNPTVVFSNDGAYLLGRSTSNSSVGQISDIVNVFSLPSVNLKTSLVSQNTFSSLFLDDFMDNDTLLSYNVSQSFIGNQNVDVLTVLFKKVD